jgi:hypothetical protein
MLELALMMETLYSKLSVFVFSSLFVKELQQV